MDIHVTPTRSGQAPPHACALVLFVLLGAGIGFLFWPVWLLTGLVALWVVLE